jgi:tRNA(Ile2) C34 agmatinyltransferase TiaS
MSALATRPGTSAAIEPPPAGNPAPTLFERERVTLEDVVLRVWEDLALEGRAGCPVCGGSMSSSGCADCGTELD